MPKNQSQKGFGYYPEAQRGKGPSEYQHTFSTLSFVSVGDPYGRRRLNEGARFTGKQFSTSYPKKGMTADVYFSGDFKILHGPYKDTQPQRYLLKQPREKRKNAFGSGDASKRDEFMNTTRSTIMLQTFKKENRMQNAMQAAAETRRQGMSKSTEPVEGMVSPDLLNTSLPEMGKKKKKRRPRNAHSTPPVIIDESYDEGRNGPEFLYDIGRFAETSFCSRSKRERWYEPRLHADTTTWSHGDTVVQGVTKRLGSTAVNISSRAIGLGARETERLNKELGVPVEFDASPYSRRSVLQQQLNRNCGALLPPFTQQAISTAGPPGSTLLL